MRIDVQDAPNQFIKLLQHVAAGGEVTITSAGVSVARLVPAEAAKATEGASFVSTQKSQPYTEKQGRYLAFIHHYTKLHGRPPSESEMQGYFRVTPPSVHQMVLTLERRGLIKRTPGQARSIYVLVPRDDLPDLS
ncbi:MAG TPA: type II toxin-antitoxin system prevent-host-death family antitoxin [Candidatus Angelobacter sp.]|nr:type II toxin-antitoxin system prevent-host-death family antitoxin [Candidatus Angelobacter sp.]